MDSKTHTLHPRLKEGTGEGLSSSPVSFSASSTVSSKFRLRLQRRLFASNVKTIAVAAHPGAARTNIMRNAPMLYRALVLLMVPFGLLFAQSAAMGALPILRAATDLNVQGSEY
jgi:hypothetical protein